MGCHTALCVDYKRWNFKAQCATYNIHLTGEATDTVIKSLWRLLGNLPSGIQSDIFLWHWLITFLSERVSG
jgi:hypothetical protein